MISTIARISRQKPKVTISLWVACAGLLVTLASVFSPAWIEVVSLPNSESAKALELLKKGLPNAQLEGTETQGMIVFNAEDGIVLHRESIEKYLNKIEENPSQSNVVGVRSPLDLDYSSQISSDGKTAFAVVFFSDKVEFDGLGENVIDDARELRKEITVEFSGLVFDSLAVPKNEAIGVIAAAVVLFLVLGSLVAAGLPIVSAIGGVLVGASLVRLLAFILPIPEVAFFIGLMLGIGVGIDYTLFIVTRYREALARGKTVDGAIDEAMATSGVAVFSAGITVVISILGILIINLDYLSGIAIGVSLCVFIMMIMALTLVPALLASSFGRHLDKIPLPKKLRRKESGTGWIRWSHFVQRNALAGLLAGLAILLIISSPVLSLRIGVTDVGNESTNKTTKRAYDLLADSFGPGFNGPLIIVVDRSKATDSRAVIKLMREIEDQETVSTITPDPGLVNATDQVGIFIDRLVNRENPDQSANNDSSTKRDIFAFVLRPTTPPQSQKTTDLVNDIRNKIVVEQNKDTGVKAYVTGITAGNIDFASTMKTRLPIFMIAVLLLSFIFLLFAFRSVLVALKAIAMNLISILAAYGVVVAVFQWGWFASFLGVGTPGPIEPWAPLMLFAILFGLSMDYEVFLISKIKEEYEKSGDNSKAVANGLASTARVITAAAVIMACVFGSFAFSDDRPLKLMGLGLAIAVLLDATVVRMLLVPASMELLGDKNWWFPQFLDRFKPFKKQVVDHPDQIKETVNR